MSRIIHGMYGTRLYRVWNGMKDRCLNPNSKDYRHYGGRGITICDEWKEPTAFFNWALENGYREDLTIDRIDNDKGYCPNNCRWITNSEQQRNRGFNQNIEYKGETKCVSEWSRKTGIARQTIQNRLESGWDVYDALTKPPMNKGGKKKSCHTNAN